MIKKKAILLGLVVLLGGVAVAVYAQDAPKGEVAGMFTYDRFHPANQYAPNANLWGGGGEGTYFLNKYFGIKGELIGYGSTTSTYTFSSDFTTPGGVVIPAGTYRVSGNLFTYLFGPVVKVRGKAEPFGEILFGAAHTNVYANLYSAAGVTGAKPDNNGFAMAVGGGLDIPVSKSVAIRVAELDYVLTRLGRQTFTNNLNSFRYQAGIVFSFGGK